MENLFKGAALLALGLLAAVMAMIVIAAIAPLLLGI